MQHPATKIATVVSELLGALCVPVTVVGATPAPAQATESATLTADIPALPLAQALAAFSRQTDLHLVYVSEVVRNKKSHAVSAGVGAEAALGQLLQGTGLRFQYLTPVSVRILAAAPVPEVSAKNLPAEELSEVVVTASRRGEENPQNVPITIQVLGAQRLKELHVDTFDDLLKYAANVTCSGNGPGTCNVFMRGLGSVDIGNQTQSAVAPFPNVALYLDEQSMQFPARNNDVYIVDLERIEVLEGPQGTLFGGGAEAGAIRYITNKPKLGATTGEVSASYGTTTGGAPNTSLNATLNLPLIPDKLAVRAVIFSDRRGGYIANVPGTISFNLPSSYLTQTGFCSPPFVTSGCNSPYVRLVSPVANNANLVGPDSNPITYGGVRLSALYQLDDRWNLLIQQSYQDMDAEGYFYAYPADPNGKSLQPYQITAFTPAFTRDRYESTAWTLNGEFASGLKAVYAGSYMVRHIDGQQDYSNYLRSFIGTYYACTGLGAAFFYTRKPLQCYAPVANWRDIVKNEHQSHEVRISTSGESRVRALLGAYWEKFVIDDDMNFNYLAIPQCSPANLAIALAGGPDCVSAVGPLPGTQASDPGLRENVNNAFGEDVQRGYKQYAFFASVDLDIVPKVLTVSAGTRRYHYDDFEEGSVWYSESSSALIFDHPNGACTAAGLCGYPINLSKSESGFRSRANLTWHVTPDVMAYYTFSQGFRPGGFNRVASLPGQPAPPIAAAPYCGPASTDPRCLPGGSLFNKPNTDQYLASASFGSDNLTSNELGLKSELLNDRLVVNASAYLINWNDVQWKAVGLSCLCGASDYVNGPNYTNKGLELQLSARVTDGLTLQGASTWNSSKQTDVPCLRSVGVTPLTRYNPTPAGQCITVIGGSPFTELGVFNTPAPFSPALMFNLRLRYEWGAGAFRPFAWAAASHIASMINEPASYPDGSAPLPEPREAVVIRYVIPATTTYDAALGATRDDWTLQLSGSNLTNAYGPANITSGQFIKAEIPLRPRVLTAQFAYRF